MDWHARYSLQATWTRDLRSYLFERAGLQQAQRVLEVGCGTGAILAGLESAASIHGLDIDLPALLACRSNAPSAVLTQGDALQLPYAAVSFDIVFCHYLLLWLGEPVAALREMKRITRRGGYVLAMAEPDYSARLDEPQLLKPLGHWQGQALLRQGADPAFGARLAEAFSEAGLDILETGQIQSRTPKAFSQIEWNSEWDVLESDLAGIIPRHQLQKMKRLDHDAWLSGKRVLEVPTYFAYART